MEDLSTLLGDTDIYLLDQIMKGRYHAPERILDAGAGAGRNLHWFTHSGFDVYGADKAHGAIVRLLENYPEVTPTHFKVAPLENLPYEDGYFNHIICSAVLHFAESHAHFDQMFAEMIRVLHPGGSIFIRVATDIGMADQMIPLGEGRYQMPDGTDRYLLTKPALEGLLQQYPIQLLEPFKSVVVDNQRSMGVLVLGKTGI